MGCTPPVRTFQIADREVVFSTGATNPGTSDIFVMSADSLMEIATLVAKVRATLRIENKTEAFQCKVVYQTSDDGETWGSPVDISSGYISNNGYDTSDWASISNPKRAIRFGVICAQATGNDVESGRVSVVVDILLLS